jgi:diacylglycerol kinase family enzyme
MTAAESHVYVIVNSRSGSSGDTDLADHISANLRACGMHVEIALTHTGADLQAAIARASSGTFDVVVAGGGDGTIAAVAGGVVGTRSLFGVLPLGTFNYFARRFAIPLDVDGALEVIAAGATRSIGIGEVNGRFFLNNSSIGLYPAVLQHRETTYRRIGRNRAVAYVSVALLLLQPPAFLNLRLTVDGRALARRTSLLFVGVNPEQMAEFAMPGKTCIDANRLALAITRPIGGWRLARLALRAFFRGLHGAAELEVLCAHELEVNLRRRQVRVAMDGEVALLQTPLRYRMKEDALRVLVPAAAGDQPAPA